MFGRGNPGGVPASNLDSPALYGDAQFVSLAARRTSLSQRFESGSALGGPAVGTQAERLRAGTAKTTS